MREIWLPVPGYPKYMVSTYGDIVNNRTDRLLKSHIATNGFYRVTLDRSAQYVHRVVASTFFDDYRPELRVKHINGDRSNNRFDNLKLLEPQLADGAVFVPMGRPKPGIRIEIVETGDVFRSVRDVANYIGGSYSAVYACLRGERDHHLGYHFRWF